VGEQRLAAGVLGGSGAYDVTDSVVGLARTLRAAGVRACPERVQAAVRALAVLDPGRREHVYWAGRLTLCGSRDEQDRYDRVFAAYFGDRPGAVIRRPRVLVPRLRLVATDGAADRDDGGDGDDGDRLPPASAAASSVEQLRHRDVRTLGPAERAELNRLLAVLALPGELRPTRRRRPASRGEVDAGRTLRAWLRAGGEPDRLRRRAPVPRPRRVVLLVDVSGSMDVYADALLRFAHAAVRRGAGPAEVFALGTRLSRVTREMAQRDPDAAMAAVAAAVPDAGGGTRLGVLLKDFLDRWGQRGTARGAVVVVLSDGWERGDATLLGDQMARLRRLAHRVVWSNPRKAAPGYAPLAAGMAAALPHVDDFVEGHSLAALEQLAAVVQRRRVDA
jgi:uncharacterized protein with von Willebrand factor type A (vWA) domain